jgi:hypothetical protein
MIYNKLQKFGREKGWYRTESAIFGNYKGFLINIFQGGIMSSPQYKHIICEIEPLTDSQVMDLQKVLDDHKKTLKFAIGEVGKDYIALTFHENLSYIKAAKLDETLEFILKTLNERGIRSTLNEKSTLTAYNMCGKGFLLTQNQYLENVNAIEEGKIAHRLSRPNYLNGFIGSLIYSLPIIILWVLLAYYLERISTGFGVLIALAGSYGYEKYNGKIGFWTKWLLIVSNVLVIVLANICVMAFTLSQLGVSIDEMLDIFNRNALIQKDFKTNLFISLMLGIIGWLQIAFSHDLKGDYIEEAKKL